MAKPKTIAIITGASAGLGSEFAKQISTAHALNEVWIIARREAPLLELAREIPNAKVLVLDLKEPSAWQFLKQKLEAEKPTLRFLVNNAGLGRLGSFAEASFDEQIEMIDVNIRALTALTHIALPHMTKGSALIQVASSIAYNPSPRFAVYAATKAFVLSLSHALSVELKSKGIAVLAVCPGPVATEFQAVARTSKDSAHYALMAQPRDVVRKALKDLQKQKVVSVYGWAIHLFVFLTKIIPTRVLLAISSRR